MPAMPHISSRLLQTERPADAALDVRAEDGVVAPDVVAMPETSSKADVGADEASFGFRSCLSCGREAAA
jgi:hypothetical protein